MRVSTKTLSTRLAIVSTLFLATACTLHRAAEEGNAGIKDDDATAGARADDEEAKLPPKAEAKTSPQSSQLTTAPETKQAHSGVNATALTGRQAPLKRAAHLQRAKAPSRTAVARSTVARSTVARSTVAKAASEERMIRYVTAESLNVRTAPRADAPVVGRLARGSMFSVTQTGNWARLGEGQYVLAKFLSRSQPDRRLASK